MIFGKEVYRKLMDYIDDNVEFNFLENIPGSDKDARVQKDVIYRMIELSSRNDIFLDYISYTYNLVSNNIVQDILSLTWSKASGAKKYIIDDDNFNLSKKQLSSAIILLLVVRDILHTQPIGNLPIFNEYKYKQNEFVQNVKDTLRFSIDSLTITEPDLSPIFISIAAKSIMPYTKIYDDLSSTSRLIAILFHLSRYMALYPYQDSSQYLHDTFTSALINLKNNASFFGLDKNMIESILEKAMLGEISWTK